MACCQAVIHAQAIQHYQVPVHTGSHRASSLPLDSLLGNSLVAADRHYRATSGHAPHVATICLCLNGHNMLTWLLTTNSRNCCFFFVAKLLPAPCTSDNRQQGRHADKLVGPPCKMLSLALPLPESVTRRLQATQTIPLFLTFKAQSDVTPLVSVRCQ